jgi:hypothetical protein
MQVHRALIDRGGTSLLATGKLVQDVAQGQHDPLKLQDGSVVDFDEGLHQRENDRRKLNDDPVAGLVHLKPAAVFELAHSPSSIYVETGLTLATLSTFQGIVRATKLRLDLQELNDRADDLFACRRLGVR